MSHEIDRTLEMLSWNNSEKIQIQGIEDAKKITHLSILIQPLESKSIWENCAKVLASKSDQELERYLVSLFQWLQDMNWPGAYIIYDRLSLMPKHFLRIPYSISLKLATNTGDSAWKQSLEDFWRQLNL